MKTITRCQASITFKVNGFNFGFNFMVEYFNFHFKH